MKILWIEDFGAGLKSHLLSLAIFGDIITEDELMPNDLADEEVDDEQLCKLLPKAIKKKSSHDLFLCRSYSEYKKTYLLEKGEFDIVLIDINLTKLGKTLPNILIIWQGLIFIEN